MIFFNKDERRNILFFLFLYSISNLFFLLNFNGIYWDDWVIYNHEYETINNMFYQAVGGVCYFISLLHYTLINIGNGIYIYKLLTFSFVFFNGILIYEVLKKFNTIFSQDDAFFITCFYLIAPLFAAKVALINFSSILFLSFFYIAFYFYFKNQDNLTLSKRFLILFLFFISFVLKSLLVFYFLFLICVYISNYYKKHHNLKVFWFFIKDNFDFILLPVFFFVVSSLFFSSSGYYSDYNKIELVNFTAILNDMRAVFSNKYFYFLLFYFLSLFLVCKKRHNDERFVKMFSLFLFGIGVLFLGALAYLMVGKLPINQGWNSRHQILLPLGFSFVSYYFIKCGICAFSLKKNIQLGLFGIIFLLLCLIQWNDGVRYNVDHFYQQSIIANFKKDEILRANDTFMVNVNLHEKLAKNRRLRFYELNGLSKKAFGSESKFFGIYKHDFKKIPKYINEKQFNFHLYEKKSTMKYFVIAEKEKDKFDSSLFYTMGEVIRLRYLEIFNQEQFDKEINELVYLKH